MTTSFRHTLLVLAVACMAVACNDNSISSDALGTGGIGQGKIEYDSIPGMRAASGDTLDIIDAVQIGLGHTVHLYEGHHNRSDGKHQQ